MFCCFVPGCKIKALRAKTNTYIKTPVRGEEPVFVVTGRKEDVTLAKREIISAAEHFSQIRAQRKNNTLNSLAPGPPSPNAPGTTTIKVRVPYRVVGLVVGPKGATIKNIQQKTNTYIVTPSRDKEPVFEVTGLSENVESARNAILNHISMRTGGLLDAPADDNVFHNGDSLHTSFSDFNPGSIYSSGSQSSYSSFRDASSLSSQQRSYSTDSYSYSGSNKITDYNPINSPFSPNGFFFNDLPSPTERDVGNETNTNGSSFEVAPTPPSPSIWASEKPGINRVVSEQAPFTRASTVGSTRSTSPHSAARRLRSDPLSSSFTALQAFTPFSSTGAAVNTSPDAITSSAVTANGKVSPTSQGIVGSAIGTRPTSGETNNNNLAKADKKKDCVICYESDVVAALVPCGHNLFCMECANRIKDENSPCPVCQKEVNQVLRIFS